MWVGVHPMQSVFLGSDRRYNRYWLFLGPCNANDPGHGRVYFESSEDGHWEVIDAKEVIPSFSYVSDFAAENLFSHHRKKRIVSVPLFFYFNSIFILLKVLQESKTLFVLMYVV